MKLDEVKTVAYTEREELLNCITHALGFVLSFLILKDCVLPAWKTSDTIRMICAVMYFLGTTAMFTVSVMYHAAKGEKKKKILRILDHCVIFFAVSGTASGCVPAVFDTVGTAAAVLMLISAWLGAAGGLFVSFLGFEKWKAVKMIIYILTALVCAVCGAKAYFVLPIGAFFAFLGGSSLLIVGLVFYGLGRTRRYYHAVFHFFILAGLFVYWLGISGYCYQPLVTVSFNAAAIPTAP